MAVEFWIDIENSAGQRQGSGPITSASRWRYTARMDKAGTFEFEMPASDPKAVSVRRKYIARAYALMNGQRVEVGAGIIDQIEKAPQADGTVMLRVRGDDLIRELTYRSVLNLKLYSGGNPVSHAAAVAAVGAYAPPGWTFVPDNSPPNNSIYGYFNGETVLAGMIKVADKSQNHFYRGSGRSLIFASSFTASGVRAIQARGNLSPATCAIVSLTEQIDTYDLITRIYPRGSGNANAQLTLRPTTRTAPSGYVLNKTANYIESTAATATYGRIERQIPFRDIGPVDNTDADLQAAANMLFDAALEHLRRYSTELEQATYTISVAGCSQLLRPMQTIRVVYRDLAAGLDINTDLNILEATWQVDTSGIQTTDLLVSNADQWPKSDIGTLVENIAQGHVYQALPQLNANSYVTAYTKHVDSDEVAQFRFRFGNEVTQLQQVLFEFQILPFESTVKSVAGETSTSSNGGGSVESASAGGSHTHAVTIPQHTHTVTIPAHTHTVTIPAHTHSVTIPAHTHSVTIPAHSHSVTIPGHSHSVIIPGHEHGINVIDTPTPGSPSMKTLFLDISGEFFAVGVAGTGNVEYVPTTKATSNVVQTSSPQSEVVNSSSERSQVINSSGQRNQVVNSSGQRDQIVNSSGQQAQTVVSSSLQSQVIQTSSTNGTHAHTVTIPNHTHRVTPAISTIYGIFRNTDANTYDIGDLEYRVNGGSWATLDDASSAGDGWYQLDITDLVMDSTTFRPLQSNNLLEIRAATSGPIPFNSYSTLGQHSVRLTFSTPHGLAVGQLILIEDADIGSFFGSNINGQARVTSVEDSVTVLVDPDTEGFRAFDGGAGGTVQEILTATIDAQLSVRNIIQATAYV